MLCKVVRGSVRWRGRNRQIGEIVDITQYDYERLGSIVELYDAPVEEPDNNNIAVEQPELATVEIEQADNKKSSNKKNNKGVKK